MITQSVPHTILTGVLQRDFLILPDGKAYTDIPGGNLLYTAAGMLLWDQEAKPGIVARVGEDYPQQWLEVFQKRGLNTQGIQFLPEALDVRSFSAYTKINEYTRENPVAHYAEHRLAFPKALFGYHNNTPTLESRTRLLPTSLRTGDFSPEFLEATTAHIAPLDFLTHSLIPSFLRQGNTSTITLTPTPGYMDPAYWSDIPSIVGGLTAFLPSENNLRNLFKERTQDVWEMAEAIGSYGCELVIIRRDDQSQYVYDSSGHKRWFVPAYPSRSYHTHGVGDVFCGGFLAGYQRSYDPLEAALYGNVTASLASEGVGAFYILDVEPRLPAARLESLRRAVRRL